ncbi:MAG TPA: hypothetical protein VGS79_17950 [Puia sp.]|nr:hypothetical protein [Puia sp.]
MVYTLLALSALATLGLNIWQRYMEYFPPSRTSVYQPSNKFIIQTIRKNFFRKQPSDQNDPHLKVKIALLAGFKKFCLSFCMVSMLFSILQAWLTISAYNNLSEQTVFEIETRIHWLKEKTEPFEKFKFFPELVLLALLIGLAATWPLIERLKLKDRYKSLMKGFGFLTGLLTIAICFTFYGNRFEKGEKGVEGKLQIHNFQLLENNQLLVKQIHDLAEKNVVQAFTDAQKVKQVFDERTAANKAVDSFQTTSDYSYYTEYTLKAPTQQASTVSADDAGGGSGESFNHLRLDEDVITAGTKYEQQFTTTYATWRSNQPWAKQPGAAQSSPAAGYYQDLGQALYDDEVKSGVVNEKSISTDRLAAEQAVMEEAASEWSSQTFKIFDQYGELFEKTLDKTYSITLKGWINGAAENIFSGIPLIGELLDPVHDMLKDMIKEKFKKLLTAFGQKDKTAVTDELLATMGEMNTALASKTVDLNPWQRLRAQVISVRKGLGDISRKIQAANSKTQRLISAHLEQMKNTDRWQALRERFGIKARYSASLPDPLEPFSREQWQGFQQILTDWDDYMHSHKETWWKDGTKDLEKEFVSYIQERPEVCGAWGFILQQEDWNKAADYYTFVATDVQATGKPYFLLKYYCETTKNCTIDNLYTEEVERKGVGLYCPH